MNLRDAMAMGDVFQGYAYAYPHKMAYGPLDPPLRLDELWAAEEQDALFLYLHIPFCEMRCGFCNLFTTTHPGAGLVDQYLQALEHQMEVVRSSLSATAQCARVAIGGGTPTFLEAGELHRLFQAVHRHFAISTRAPVAIELSPGTTTDDRLAVLREWGISRVSLGVQSFVESETRALGRQQKPEVVRAALQRLRKAQFPVLNIDLIYGAIGQTRATWRTSLSEAIAFAPEEIYLYPLYVRPLTGLGKHGDEPSDDRLMLYREGRDFLLEHGYRQVSMRLFRAPHYSPPEGPMYCCQEDGMVGLGAGARSYTRACHYSTDWAVGRAGVKAIIDDYVQRSPEGFAFADYGCVLSDPEQRRRYLIKSLLRKDGLDERAYQVQFGTPAIDDFPELSELDELDLTQRSPGWLRLNQQGLELSDLIGPWLFSEEIRARMATFALA